MTNRTARNRPRADRAERKRVVRDWAERTRVVRNRAERTRVVRIRAERTRVVCIRAERTRVAHDRAERKRVVRNRAERTRVVCIRAERTRSRYASVRAFVERLNAQPYELFKPRRRPPLSPRQFSPSTRVYRCLMGSISRHLFNRCLIGSISRHAFNLCLANAFLSVHATLCLLNCCQAAFASSTVVVPLSPVIRCQTSVVLHPLSALCCHSAVVGQWGGMGSLPSVSHSRRTNGREAEMSLSSWRWIWSNQDLSNQDGNEDANNN